MSLALLTPRLWHFYLVFSAVVIIGGGRHSFHTTESFPLGSTEGVVLPLVSVWRAWGSEPF